MELTLHRGRAYIQELNDLYLYLSSPDQKMFWGKHKGILVRSSISRLHFYFNYAISTRSWHGTQVWEKGRGSIQRIRTEGATISGFFRGSKRAMSLCHAMPKNVGVWGRQPKAMSKWRYDNRLWTGWYFVYHFCTQPWISPSSPCFWVLHWGTGNCCRGECIGMAWLCKGYLGHGGSEMWSYPFRRYKLLAWAQKKTHILQWHIIYIYNII
jgi:hypothetical protein